jgi:hypothetical protein
MNDRELRMLEQLLKTLREISSELDMIRTALEDAAPWHVVVHKAEDE